MFAKIPSCIFSTSIDKLCTTKKKKLPFCRILFLLSPYLPQILPVFPPGSRLALWDLDPMYCSRWGQRSENVDRWPHRGEVPAMDLSWGTHLWPPKTKTHTCLGGQKCTTHPSPKEWFLGLVLHQNAVILWENLRNPLQVPNSFCLSVFYLGGGRVVV